MKFEIGDTVWVAQHRMDKVSHVCPVCFGQLKVKVILGNLDEVIVPCDYCGHGWEKPSGVIYEYEWINAPLKAVITGTQITKCGTTEKVEYYSYSQRLDSDKIFATEEEAQAKCEQLKVEHEEEQRTRAYYLKHDKLKNYSWNAGYHLREAKRDEESAALHRTRAQLCKAKAKEV